MSLLLTLAGYLVDHGVELNQQAWLKLVEKAQDLLDRLLPPT
jgi:hypothetical protein